MQLFNSDWMFLKLLPGTTLQEAKASDGWLATEIPTDWLIYDVNNLYENSEGWYKKIFNYNPGFDGERVILRFDGVYMDCSLYINETLAGEWKYGYSTFEFDVSDYLKNGENEILLCVRYQSPNSRWYSGAGIYRNVWLKTKRPINLASDGIYITPVLSDEGTNTWDVCIDTEIASFLNSDNNIELTQKIFFGCVETASKSVTAKAGNCVVTNTLKVSNPNLWSIETPSVYKLQTEIFKDGELWDIQETSFGFRTIECHRDKGFFLNGKHVKIYGVCMHHDLGCLGAAINKTALKRQLCIMQEMGVNAVRTSHNMPAPELMELADEMGILVCSEAFDMWERSKTTYDYARFFKEWAEKDTASWVRRDRNHPSLIMWSIGNEIYDTHADEYGVEITKRLLGYVRKHDSKCHAPVTIGSNYMSWENAQKCADVVKLAGYNYAEKLYNDHHEKYKDWIIYGSETASTVQSRGIYHFPLRQSLLSDDDEQCSSLGNSTTSWGAKNSEACITDDRDAEFSLGQFIWSGFDYIGEPTPYSTKNSYFGQVDTAGFKKDSFYIFQSAWTDYKLSPMIHIFPYWDFSKGQPIDVRVCTNAPKLELFFNEKSMGSRSIDRKMDKEIVANYQIPYEAGVLRAVAYDESNNIIAEDIRRSFGDAAKITISADKTEILADGSDLAFIEISAVDKEGNPVENANNRVEVSVSGAGRLIGLDNGDSTDYDQYKGTSRRLFSGKLLAVIASTDKAGKITVTVNSKDVDGASIELNALDCQYPAGASRTLHSNKPSKPNDEIPIRKIELISKSNSETNVFKLNKDTPAVTIHAKIYPENATYSDLEWRVTNVAGIDTNIASVRRIDPLTVEVTAVGDGEIYVRCMTKNGRDKIRLISQFPLTISGFGLANLNPYSFISGGLHNASNVPMANGNDRGVATSRDGVSHVGFKGVDFGEYGSDEITLPIFPLTPEPFNIGIWEGMPEEGGEKICDVVYDKGSKWNTYQEETYVLPRRLKGITTLCFVVDLKIHLKGFIFKKYEKAYSQNFAGECLTVYGDSFDKTDTAIENIGNNVSIEFSNMDFSEKGLKGITICGRTPLKKNTVQIRFDGETQIVEFENSGGEYSEQSFELSNVQKNCEKVTFVFLPGSQFDFKWFRFEL